VGTSPGTLERIAQELGRALLALEAELPAENVRTLFASLGLQLPPQLEGNAAFTTALSRVASRIGYLPGLVERLEAAVDAEDLGEIVSIVHELGVVIRDVVSGFDTIATELGAAAGGLPGIDPGDVAAFAAQLAERLAQYTFVTYLEGYYPVFHRGLVLTGLVDETRVQPDPAKPNERPFTRRELLLGRVTDLLQAPGPYFRSLYGWGDPGFDGARLIENLHGILSALGVPIDYDRGAGVLRSFIATLGPTTAVTPRGLELVLSASVPGEATVRLPFVFDGWAIELDVKAAAAAGTSVVFQPGGAITISPPAGEVSGEIGLYLVGDPPPGEPEFLILGQAGGSRLAAGSVRAGIHVAAAWDSGSNRARGDFGFRVPIRDGVVVVDISQGDGFLSSILPAEGLRFDFDFLFGWSAAAGFYFGGTGGLEIALPVHASVGPIEVQALYLRLGFADGRIAAEVSVEAGAALGPLQLSVSRIGLAAGLGLEGGNLGPLDASIAFKPPNGVGLAVDAGVVKGGGYLFLDPDRGEYAGALELVFSEWIALKAIGIITTKMPDGSKGFSLLIIITVEFGTGIQLGFGFTLLGVGGLLGLHRIAKVEPLTEGVRTGAINGVMFPENVIANAPRIISDLRRFFPPQQEVFLVGPMAKIGWGTPTLVSVTIGVILEFPSVNITILGVIRVILPDERAAVLRLQVNFIGRIEPSNKRLWFYAQLFDSRVLFITIEGGFGLLVAWGDRANFVVSAGGFHPRYDPPALPFPEPPRIGVSLLNESYARVRIQGYFAVTSNSVQFGARAELFFGVSAFNIEGHLAFDALFQFDPFFFSFSLSVSLSVKVFGVGLFSVGFSGLLEGPTPWFIQGKGRISLLFFKISVPFEHTWGRSQDTTLDPIAVRPLLEKELNALTNWQAEVPSNNRLLVSLRKLGDDDPDRLVLHPVGRLLVSQRKVPVNFKLDKVGNQKVSDYEKLVVGAALPGGEALSVMKLEEPFAIGQFRDLDASSKLSSPGFEPLESGVAIGMPGEQAKTSRAVRRVIRYETIIVDTAFRRHVRSFFDFFRSGYAIANEFLFGHFLAGASASQSMLSQRQRDRMQPFEEVITVRPNGFTVVFTEDNRPVDGAAATFTSQAAAARYMEDRVSAGGGLARRVHVVPNTEVNIGS
jgi:hypothetical protein